MRDVTAIAEPQVNIWPYIDGLNLEELGISCVNEVNYVYRDANDCFDQVLIGTDCFNKQLVIVVDRGLRRVAGHHLLDLNEYSASPGDHIRDVR